MEKPSGMFCCIAGGLALPKLNLQFLTLHDYLLRNFHLFRMESTCKCFLFSNFTNCNIKCLYHNTVLAINVFIITTCLLLAYLIDGINWWRNFVVALFILTHRLLYISWWRAVQLTFLKQLFHNCNDAVSSKCFICFYVNVKQIFCALNCFFEGVKYAMNNISMCFFLDEIRQDIEQAVWRMKPL